MKSTTRRNFLRMSGSAAVVALSGLSLNSGEYNKGKKSDILFIMTDQHRGKNDNWREVIDLEHDVCYSPSNHWNSLTDGHYKYIYHAQNGEEQLFDLKEDPDELHGLTRDPKNRSKVREWRDRMIEHLAERGEPFVVNSKPAPRPERMLYSPNYPKMQQ